MVIETGKKDTYIVDVYSAFGLVHAEAAPVCTVDEAIDRAIKATVSKYDDGLTSLVVRDTDNVCTHYTIIHNTPHELMVNGCIYNIK
jgi:hypothetical protein